MKNEKLNLNCCYPRSAEAGIRLYHKGFTLAETLIALVIIGIIAAITVPAVMQNTYKQELVSRLKKTYSVLQQAAIKVKEENGGEMVYGNGRDNAAKIYEAFKAQLNGAKECPAGSSNLCCASKVIKNGNGSNNNFVGNLCAFALVPKLVLADGTTLLFETNSRIFADLDGAKGENKFSRDIFIFKVTQDGIEPDGNAKTCPGTDQSCAKYVLVNGTIKY